MRIPTDCVLIEGMDITVDEAPYFEERESLCKKAISTGTVNENNHVENPDPFLLTRSLVITGSGKAVVCSVGKHRQIASVEQPEDLIGDDENDATPL